MRNGRITGRKVFQSDTHTVSVLPIPAPPDDYPNATWLPARDVQLSEEWSREPERINAGEPVTRRVTVSALGQIETQIPAIEPPAIDGLNIYEDKPELSRRIEAEGIRGIRKDQYAMIGVNGGDIELPELQVPWWNIDAAEWRVARLPARTITIKADTVAPVAPPAAEVSPPIAASDTKTPVLKITPDGFWQRTSQLLAAAWLLTILAWWWSSRDSKRTPREPEQPPLYKRQARLVKTARKAAQAGDAAALRAALLEWGRLQWPDDAPRSLGALAARVADPLTGELRTLSKASYGPEGSDWDRDAMAKALRSIVVLKDAAESYSSDSLPPLMPPAV